jgi:hypothetical protein
MKRKSLLKFEAFSDKTFAAKVPMLDWNRQEIAEEAIPIFVLAALDAWSDILAEYNCVDQKIMRRRLQLNLRRSLEKEILA